MQSMRYDKQSPWFSYYGQTKDHPWAISAEAQSTIYQTKLVMKLTDYRNVQFDHVRIGHLGRRIAVFVAKGNQSIVVYDKTKGFPSAKLMATLVLLGSS